MSLHIQQTQQQRLVLAPNMTLALNILRMPNLELQTFLFHQAEINPMLDVTEMETDSGIEISENSIEGGDAGEEWDGSWSSGGERENEDSESRARREFFEQNMVKPVSLHEALMTQLGCQRLSVQQRLLGEFIIHHLDEHGYLEVPLEELGGQVHGDLGELESVLQIIQTFDPPGVGARDLQECLLIQLRQQNKTGTIEYAIAERYFDHFVRKRHKALAKALRVSEEEAEAACEQLCQLNPKPGRMFAEGLPQNIIPDLRIHKREDHYDVELTDQRVPFVGINRYYFRMLRNPQTSRDVKEFLHTKFRQASWVIKAIDERNSTLLSIARCLISLQSDFLEHGLKALTPLTQTKVAGLIGRHPSTVSRAIAGKTIDTPFGILKLEQFFATAVPQEESQPTISDAKIKAEIRNLIDAENPDKPLSDEALSRNLKERNFRVARRTVAKYRTAMKILPAHLRRRSRNT